MRPELKVKYERLRTILASLDSVAVAFSAGADSTLVLGVAAEVLGPKAVVAVTGRSDSIARDELDHAARLAEQLGIEHVTLDTGEFADENYLSNPTNRCYFCKTELYTHMGAFLSRRQLKHAVNGVNADDLGDHRPGIEAAREHGVRAPLAEAGFTKDDVRELSRHLGLPTFDKPASPCLSSRIPYGQRVTPEKLRMIEAAESYLRELGIRECRVRHHEEMARIEVPPEDFPILIEPVIARRVDEHLRSLGYKAVTLDLRGFRSGSLNEGVELVGRRDQGIKGSRDRERD